MQSKEERIFIIIKQDNKGYYRGAVSFCDDPNMLSVEFITDPNKSFLSTIIDVGDKLKLLGIYMINHKIKIEYEPC